MTKMTGKEFKAFYVDPDVWGPRAVAKPTYCDDTVISVNGIEMEDWEMEAISDDDLVIVLDGHLCDRSSTRIPESFTGAARWWLKRQRTATLIVECDKDKIEAVAAAIKAAGGKVCK